MKAELAALCDEFYTTTRLAMKLGLSMERESTLHFFDRVRREYPSMCRFRRRDDNVLVLEENEEEDEGPRRWLRLDRQTFRFGYVAPSRPEDVIDYGQFLLHQAPPHLTLSDLDIDYLEVVFGFDMEYSGNHDQLVADTLFGDHPMASFINGPHAAHMIDCQPCFGIALSSDCHEQAYIEIKSRTSSFEVRTEQFDAQVLSVYLTIRRYWPGATPVTLPEAYLDMQRTAHELAVDQVVPLWVNPLAQAIASRP